MGDLLEMSNKLERDSSNSALFFWKVAPDCWEMGVDARDLYFWRRGWIILCMMLLGV